MRIDRLFLAPLLLLMLGWTAATRSDPLPFEPKPFVQSGVLEKIDDERDRVIFRADTGQRYTLDMTDSAISLANTTRHGTLPDLRPGMRVYVSGQLLSPNIAEAMQVRVLGSKTIRPTPRAIPAPRPTSDSPGIFTVRGNVKAVDVQRGSFVLSVQEHTRTILLADDTDLVGLGKAEPQKFPVKIGDRVTVAGALQPDGTVLAGAISFSRDIVLPVRTLLPRSQASQSQTLVGRVSSTSDRYSSRDIKIRLEDDQEVKVKVPRGVAIRRDGQPISVHDLRGGDLLRVSGKYEGEDFRASHMEVVPDDGNAGVSGGARL